jgi:hypothetical protein
MLKFLSSAFRRKPSSIVNKHGYINTPADVEKAIHSPSGFAVVNSDEANYERVKRINYRVIVPAGVTDAQLLRMFKELDTGKYNEVTVWCYKSMDEIIQFKPYTVAMLERLDKKSAIRITRR